MKKIALVTGITGQDGSYLAELLVEKGYEVHGLIRRASSFNTERIDSAINNSDSIRLHYGDLTDSSNLIRLVKEIQPDEIYNLGACLMLLCHLSLQNMPLMWTLWVLFVC